MPGKHTPRRMTGEGAKTRQRTPRRRRTEGGAGAGGEKTEKVDSGVHSRVKFWENLGISKGNRGPTNSSTVIGKLGTVRQRNNPQGNGNGGRTDNSYE